MRFQEYITERTMDFEKALKIFGMSAVEANDKLALKKKYRDLAMQHHPDKGGDVKMAQDVNDAYAVLAKSKVASSSGLEDWKERQKKEEAFAEQLKQSLLSDFHPELYTTYFKEHSGYDFDFKFNPTKKGYPGFDVQFFTKDKKTVFTLKAHADMHDVKYNKGLGTGDISYNIYTDAQGLHLNKKQKMSQRDWGFTRDHSFLKKPEQLFPVKKMKSIFSGSTSKRAFKKRDMESYLKMKLDADLQFSGGTTWARIPLGDDYLLTIFRTTFMRKGAWSLNGIYKKKGKYSSSRVSNKLFVTFMEEEETAKIFDKIQKEAKKASEETKIDKTEKLLKQAYEAYKKSKGM